MRDKYCVVIQSGSDAAKSDLKCQPCADRRIQRATIDSIEVN